MLTTKTHISFKLLIVALLLLLTPLVFQVGNTMVYADKTTPPPADVCAGLTGQELTVCQQSKKTEDKAAQGGNCSSINKCDLISKYINPLINFLSAAVGIAVVMSIIIGGIQYSSAAGDPQRTSAAKNRIRNAIIALVVFIFLLALLNFLIPGGI